MVVRKALGVGPAITILTTVVAEAGVLAVEKWPDRGRIRGGRMRDNR